MSNAKRPAQVVGIVACATLGWAAYQVALSTGCTTAAGDCPPDWYVYVLAGGLAVAIITTFFGGGRPVFLGVFVAIGGGFGLGGLQVTGEQRTTFLIIAASFLVVVLLPVLLIPFGVRKRRRAARLLEHGVQAIGTVTSVRDTGVTINKNPRVELVLRIEPQDGSSSFEGTKTATFSRLKLPYQGQRFPVWFDRDDRRNFMLGAEVTADAAPEVRRLFALAQAGDPGIAGTQDAIPPSHVPPPVSAVDPLDRLAKLNKLRLAGALTEAEFEAEKAKVLGAG